MRERQGGLARWWLIGARQEGPADGSWRGVKLILALAGGDEQGRNRGLAPPRVIATRSAFRERPVRV